LPIFVVSSQNPGHRYFYLLELFRPSWFICDQTSNRKCISVLLDLAPEILAWIPSFFACPLSPSAEFDVFLFSFFPLLPTTLSHRSCTPSPCPPPALSPGALCPDFLILSWLMVVRPFCFHPVPLPTPVRSSFPDFQTFSRAFFFTLVGVYKLASRSQTLVFPKIDPPRRTGIVLFSHKQILPHSCPGPLTRFHTPPPFSPPPLFCVPWCQK